MVGGGVVGCAVALEAARRGASVVLLERDRIAAGASYGAGGMLAPQVEADRPGPPLQLGLRARGMFPGWCAALEGAAGLDMGGILRVAATLAGAEPLRERARWQNALGLEARLCDPVECAALVPGAAPAVLGLWVPDGRVDAHRFTLAVAQAALCAGAEIREGVPVSRVLDGAVETAGVRWEAGAVVVAAGAWSGLVCGVPVVPVKGQRLMLRHTGTPLPLTLWSDRCYLVPKAGGRVLVGATEEPEAGFDRRPTVAGVAGLAAAAAATLPALAGAELEEAWAGFRPAAPDRLPLLGRLPGHERTWLATGHHRNGILLAPLTGLLMAEAILEGAALPAACDPGRLKA